MTIKKKHGIIGSATKTTNIARNPSHLCCDNDIKTNASILNVYSQKKRNHLVCGGV